MAHFGWDPICDASLCAQPEHVLYPRIHENLDSLLSPDVTLIFAKFQDMLFRHGGCTARPPGVVNASPTQCTSHFCSRMALLGIPVSDDSVQRHSKRQCYNETSDAPAPNVRHVFYKTNVPQPFALTLITTDLGCKSWISSRFKVLHRFRHHFFQRRRWSQPKQLFSFLRLEISDNRDALCRSRHSSGHIWDSKLRCRINFRIRQEFIRIIRT